MALAIFLRFLPTLIGWALYLLSSQYPEYFPAVGAPLASAVTVANLVPSPLKVKAEAPAGFDRK